MTGQGMNSKSELIKLAAWATTRPINGLGAALYPPDARLDELGNVVRFSEYGNHSSLYGWEIDHRQPSALGGSNHATNLRALSCRTNRSLGGLLGNALSNL